jgi:hypothetical protein
MGRRWRVLRVSSQRWVWGFGSCVLRGRRGAGRGAWGSGVVVFGDCESGSGAFLGARDISGRVVLDRVSGWAGPGAESP